MGSVVARLQIAIAAAILAGGLAAALVLYGDRERRFAGTNSTGPSAPVSALEPGRTLCVRDLWLPPDAAAMSLFLGTGGAPPARVDATVAVGRRTLRSSTSVTTSDGAPAMFPLRTGGAGGPARVCLRAAGRVGEVRGTQTEPFLAVNYVPRLAELGGRPNATLDGAPLSGLVTVRFHEARSTSKIERLGDATRRAALFRAGWVGPWTYVLLIAGMPLLWLAGLVALWRLGR